MGETMIEVWVMIGGTPVFDRHIQATPRMGYTSQPGLVESEINLTQVRPRQHRSGKSGNPPRSKVRGLQFNCYRRLKPNRVLGKAHR